jgi:hypothetical protein
MIEALLQAGPAAWLLPACALVVAVALRWTSWALIPALLVLAAALQVAGFDGQPHLTEKFDATTLVWIRTVILRGVAGASLLLLAFPLANAVARWARWERRWALASYVVVPVGLGLLASSLALQHTLRALLQDPDLPGEARLAALRAMVRAANLVLAVSAGASVAGAIRLAVPLVRGGQAASRSGCVR